MIILRVLNPGSYMEVFFFRAADLQILPFSDFSNSIFDLFQSFFVIFIQVQFFLFIQQTTACNKAWFFKL